MVDKRGLSAGLFQTGKNCFSLIATNGGSVVMTAKDRHHDILDYSAQAEKAQYGNNNNHKTDDIDNVVHRDPP